MELAKLAGEIIAPLENHKFIFFQYIFIGFLTSGSYTFLLCFLIFHSINIYCKYSISILHLFFHCYFMHSKIFVILLLSITSVTAWPCIKITFCQFQLEKNQYVAKLYLPSLTNGILVIVPILNPLVCQLCCHPVSSSSLISFSFYHSSSPNLSY